jgi:hypothetical protein
MEVFMLNIVDLQQELQNKLDNALVTMDRNPLSVSFLNEVLGAIESLGFTIIPVPESPSATALDGLANSVARNTSPMSAEGSVDVEPTDINVSQILFELRNAGWILFPPKI